MTILKYVTNYQYVTFAEPNHCVEGFRGVPIVKRKPPNGGFKRPHWLPVVFNPGPPPAPKKQRRKADVAQPTA